VGGPEGVWGGDVKLKKDGVIFDVWAINLPSNGIA